MAMDTTSNPATGKIVTALIIGLIVGFAGGVFWEKRRVPADKLPRSEAAAMSDDKTKTETSDISATSTLAAVDVSAHRGVSVVEQPAGSSVSVTSVSTEAPVWVAVREEKDGGLGNILGVQKVGAGENKDISVDLLRPTVTGKKYFVVLYEDVGSPAFNYKEDILISGVKEEFQAK